MSSSTKSNNNIDSKGLLWRLSEAVYIKLAQSKGFENVSWNPVMCQSDTNAHLGFPVSYLECQGKCSFLPGRGAGGEFTSFLIRL